MEGVKLTMQEAREAEAMFVQISHLNGWQTNNTGSYRTERVRRRIAAVTKEYEVERIALVEAFGEERKPTLGELDLGANPSKLVKSVPAEKMEEFAKEHQRLLDKEVTIDTQPLALKEFDGVSVRPEMFKAIWQFVEGPPDEK